MKQGQVQLTRAVRAAKRAVAEARPASRADRARLDAEVERMTTPDGVDAYEEATDELIDLGFLGVEDVLPRAFGLVAEAMSEVLERELGAAKARVLVMKVRRQLEVEIAVETDRMREDIEDDEALLARDQARKAKGSKVQNLAIVKPN